MINYDGIFNIKNTFSWIFLYIAVTGDKRLIHLTAKHLVLVHKSWMTNIDSLTKSGHYVLHEYMYVNTYSPTLIEQYHIVDYV